MHYFALYLQATTGGVNSLRGGYSILHLLLKTSKIFGRGGSVRKKSDLSRKRYLKKTKCNLNVTHERVYKFKKPDFTAKKLIHPRPWSSKLGRFAPAPGDRHLWTVSKEKTISYV